MFIGLEELEQRTLVVVTDYSNNPSFDKKNETFSKKLKVFIDLLLAVYLIVLIAVVWIMALQLSDIKDELRKIRKLKEKEEEK